MTLPNTVRSRRRRLAKAARLDVDALESNQDDDVAPPIVEAMVGFFRDVNDAYGSAWCQSNCAQFAWEVARDKARTSTLRGKNLAAFVRSQALAIFATMPHALERFQ